MIYTVGEVNTYVGRVLQMEDLLQGVMIRGEISNLKRYRSGHMYFSLKDNEAVIRCVFFSGDQNTFAGIMKDGDKVVLTGNVSLYVRDGQYQLIVKGAKSDGIGSFYEEFERIKTKLSEEGLFDQAKKQTLPEYPKTIGVATSEHGAAVRDIVRVIDRRYNGMSVVIAPCKVQGEGAAKEIARAVKRLDDYSDIDVIIVGRGGGSIEDLWAFNDEALARVIAACKTPIISAVGHEVDFSICDFVADVRAATPSAAAELLAKPTLNDLQRLDNLEIAIDNNMTRKLSNSENILKQLENRVTLKNPIKTIDDRLVALKQTKSKLDYTIRSRQDRYDIRLAGLKQALSALSHENILKKGYSIIKDADDVIIKSVDDLPSAVTLQLYDGNAEASIRSKRKADKNG